MARLTSRLAQAKSEYESSLEQLLRLHDADTKKAEEQVLKMKELYKQGFVTRREMEATDETAANARDKVAAVQAQLKVAEQLYAEALVEAELEGDVQKTKLDSVPNSVGGWVVRKAAYIRYGGARAWSLSQAGAVEQFFRVKFGRALPVSAFGQSSLHDRWGYDHRNAMDVPLSPDSAEGRALIEYLRVNGVPFTAFHQAIAGSATGPHIHVGLPSQRFAAR